MIINKHIKKSAYHVEIALNGAILSFFYEFYVFVNLCKVFCKAKADIYRIFFSLLSNQTENLRVPSLRLNNDRIWKVKS